jgi:hypothetical protein
MTRLWTFIFFFNHIESGLQKTKIHHITLLLFPAANILVSYTKTETVFAMMTITLLPRHSIAHTRWTNPFIV